ncbi:putative tetratricopeptide-like helical domain superfamily [Helianthus annuus]|nr:putative tetratricopeptide-like helical domain superfamily [Helianthus annuus]
MKRIKFEKKRYRLYDEFFYNVIRVYGLSAGRINRVIETLLGMTGYGCWPTAKTFNFRVYVSVGWLGVEIDVCCLNIMIKGLCKNGDVDVARQVFDEMPKQGCRPNVRTFSALVHGLCENNHVEEAFSLLAKMDSEGVEPDTILMNILILGLRKNSRVGVM